MDGDTRPSWRKPLWERQERDGKIEPARAFEGFCAYRDLGPGRTLAEVGRQSGRSKAAMEPWSVKWGWVERAAAWDDEADRLQRARDLEERARTRKKMLDEHAKAGKTLVSIGTGALERFVAKTDASEDAVAEARRRVEEMSATEAARLLEVGTKMERLARGETTERIDMQEAMAWVEGFVDLALGYIAMDSQEAFLADVNARLGVGGAA